MVQDTQKLLQIFMSLLVSQAYLYNGMEAEEIHCNKTESVMQMFV